MRPSIKFRAYFIPGRGYRHSFRLKGRVVSYLISRRLEEDTALEYLRIKHPDRHKELMGEK